MKQLSDRERQVLQLAAEGLIDKEIGRKLGITLNTLRTYWSRIRSKRGDSSRSALVALYTETERRSDTLFPSASSHGDWELDIATGLLKASDAINDFYGLGRGVAHHRTAYAAKTHPDDYSRVREAWDQILEGEVEAIHLVYRVVTDQGVSCASVYGQLKRDHDGRPAKLIGHRVSSRNCVACVKPSVRVGFLRVSLPSRDVWLDDVSRDLVLVIDSGHAISRPTVSRNVVLQMVEELVKSGNDRASRDFHPDRLRRDTGWLRVDLILEMGDDGSSRVTGSVMAFE